MVVDFGSYIYIPMTNYDITNLYAKTAFVLFWLNSTFVGKSKFQNKDYK